MNQRYFRKEMIESLVIGGCILGGGGGGSMAKGRLRATLAFDMGLPERVNLEDLSDQDMVITVSSVGAPAAKGQYVQPIDFIECVRLVEKYTGTKPNAMISNENGGNATVNGLLQSAVLGIPVLDAPCNGRAHPTGVMGSIRLPERTGYISVQAAVGGQPGSNTRIKQVVEGSIDTCSHAIRQAAVQAGGLVAVARNIVPASYIKEHAAVGAITQALELGQVHQEGVTPADKVNKVVDELNGIVLGQGCVKNLKLETDNGFDIGSFVIQSDSEALELTFWNEYMTCESEDRRLSTFPDLIMTFSPKNGMPITSAELKENEEVIVISAPYSHLKLGSGMLVDSNYDVIENTIKKEIKRYIQPLFQHEVEGLNKH